MKCGHCDSDNAAGDSRCHLCGRKFDGHGPVLLGNAAPKLSAREDRSMPDDATPREPKQTRLFPVQEPKKVIPFESISPGASIGVRSTQERNARIRSKQSKQLSDNRIALIEDTPTIELQRKFGFPEESGDARQVERAVYTDAPVAEPAHRALAAAYDCAMILSGMTVLVAIFYAAGGHFDRGVLHLGSYAAVTVLVTLLYKVLWAIGNGESFGMRMADLRILNFDGCPPNRDERLMRLGVSVISFCSLGVGLLWCLFDEEKLTWHDHITKTFPSPRHFDS